MVRVRLGRWCRSIIDEEMRPMHGMYGTLDADLEVRRTIKRAELAAFLCLLRDKKGLH